MSDIFNEKVGDVYDRDGRKIGTVERQREMPGCLAVIIVLAVVVFLAISGISILVISIKNAAACGKFTPDVDCEEVDGANAARASTPHGVFITEVQLGSNSYPARDGLLRSGSSPAFNFYLVNHSDDKVMVRLGPGIVSVVKDGQSTTMELPCHPTGIYAEAKQAWQSGEYYLLDPWNDEFGMQRRNNKGMSVECIHYRQDDEEYHDYAGPISVLQAPTVLQSTRV